MSKVLYENSFVGVEVGITDDGMLYHRQDFPAKLLIVEDTPDNRDALLDHARGMTSIIERLSDFYGNGDD